MTDPSATQRLLLTWAALLVGLVGVSVLGLFIGSGVLDTDYARKMFMTLQLWRILAAFGIGAALSISGVVIQAIFQNPLAGPSIIGTTAGAALGGQLSLLLRSEERRVGT